jgi:hypothetical protein
MVTMTKCAAFKNHMNDLSLKRVTGVYVQASIHFSFYKKGVKLYPYPNTLARAGN